MSGEKLSNVSVSVFPGGFNWALYVGDDKGIFARHGIEITLIDTPNSVSQMTGFANEKFEVAMTAVDNIVAYVEGQGEAPIGPQPEFCAVMGSDNGFLSVVTRPDIARIEDFAGRMLSVDAMTTGYAFVLYDILQRHGLSFKDYELCRRGGMIQRYESLLAGDVAGTLLSAPYNAIAVDNGLREIIKASAVIGPYQGNVAAVRRSWARDNPDAVISFIRGYRESVAWLYEPAHRAEAIAILLLHLPKMTPAVAKKSYSILLDPVDGFFRDCRIDEEGMRCVLRLRSSFGVPQMQLSDVGKYRDLRYFEMAIAR